MTDMTPGYHSQDDQGGGYRISAQGQCFFPRSYYATEDGLVITCSIEVATPTKARKHILEGTADVIGQRVYYRESKDKSVRYIIRCFKVLACSTNYRGYRVVCLSDETMVAGLSTVISVIRIVLGTFVSPRPVGYIAQHDGEQYDNSLELCRWIPRHENNLKKNLDPDAAKKLAQIFTRTTLLIEKATVENDEWFVHPDVDEDVEVNQAGTHCRSISTLRYKTISVKTFIRNGWKDYEVSNKGRTQSFSRLALECFMGRKLQPRETVEHKNGERDDNSESNLLPRFRLFQIASRQPFSVNIETNTPRVYPHGNKDAFVSHIRIYTPDGKTASISRRKIFWFSHYDGGKDEALAAAITWQQQYRLEKGMIFV